MTLYLDKAIGTQSRHYFMWLSVAFSDAWVMSIDGDMLRFNCEPASDVSNYVDIKL